MAIVPILLFAAAAFFFLVMAIILKVRDRRKMGDNMRTRKHKDVQQPL